MSVDDLKPGAVSDCQSWAPSFVERALSSLPSAQKRTSSCATMVAVDHPGVWFHAAGMFFCFLLGLFEDPTLTATKLTF